MIQFQKGYTTPEQSKKLLNLGIPADSADCYYDIFSSRPIVKMPIDCFSDKVINEDYLPCWSVGRLIEIFEICTGLVWQNEAIEGYTKIDMLLEDFEDIENKYYFDFSKLEDYI